VTRASRAYALIAIAFHTFASHAAATDAAQATAAAPLADTAGNPGCQTAALVSAGGPAPKDPHTLAIRWVGYSNFELAYNGQVVLLDAYYDRGSLYPPLGVKAADIRKVDAILIGHGHFDHMSDAASIAARTHALVVGAPLTAEKLASQGLDGQQSRSVNGRGGEVLHVGAFTIEPILGRHGEPPPAVTSAFTAALRSVTAAPTSEQAAEQAAIRQRGTSDPRVTTEGTIAYLITLDNGFRLMYRDSGGHVTDFERGAMAKAGKVDVALVAVAADYLNTLTAERALEHMRAYRPDTYIPAHHDGAYNELWRATEPIFQALKQENTALVTVSRGYREPLCFDTTRKQP